MAFKVSLRTVEKIDASQICSVFGGGGHAGQRAALFRSRWSDAGIRLLKRHRPPARRLGLNGKTDVPSKELSGILLIDKPEGFTSFTWLPRFAALPGLAKSVMAERWIQWPQVYCRCF